MRRISKGTLVWLENNKRRAYLISTTFYLFSLIKSIVKKFWLNNCLSLLNFLNNFHIIFRFWDFSRFFRIRLNNFIHCLVAKALRFSCQRLYFKLLFRLEAKNMLLNGLTSSSQIWNMKCLWNYFAVRSFFLWIWTISHYRCDWRHCFLAFKILNLVNNC